MINPHTENQSVLTVQLLIISTMGQCLMFDTERISDHLTADHTSEDERLESSFVLWSSSEVLSKTTRNDGGVNVRLSADVTGLDLQSQIVPSPLHVFQINAVIAADCVRAFAVYFLLTYNSASFTHPVLCSLLAASYPSISF